MDQPGDDKEEEEEEEEADLRPLTVTLVMAKRKNEGGIAMVAGR